jgi:hypothetical protein
MSKRTKTAKRGNPTETPHSESQADGTAAEAPRGETQSLGQESTSLSDTFGEAGDPYGRGTLEVPETVIDSKEPTQGAADEKRKKDKAA